LSILSKIKYFREGDVRNKLITLSKILKINLYPNYIHKEGIKKIYSNFIFNLITREKFKKYKKENYRKIFEKKYTLKKINHLVALPRSGSNLIRNLLCSYVELYFKFGNGIPKHDGINDSWYRTHTTIIPGTIHNAVSLSEHQYLDILNVMSKEEYEKKKIIFSRHPIQRCNLFDIDKGKPIIVIRNPEDQIKSTYMVKLLRSRMFKSKKTSENLQPNTLNQIIFQNKEFYNFWNNYVKNKIKDKDFLMIKFIELQRATKDTFIKILKFYEYEIDYNLIDSVIKINSKESYLDYFGTRAKSSIRFVEFDKQEDDKINEYLKNNQDFKKLVTDYKLLHKD